MTIKFMLYPLIIIFAAVVMVFSYWNLQPTDVLDLKSPITVQPPVAQSGSPIILTLSYCKNSGAVGAVRTSFVGHAVEIFQPMGKESGPKGCTNDAKVPILLPPATTVPPGMYKIKFTVNYQVNPIKSATEVLYTQQFTIQ